MGELEGKSLISAMSDMTFQRRGFAIACPK
jgi:hypothetical protein